MQTNTINENQSIDLRTKFITINDYKSYDIILFFDCEYTCWENSIDTLWSDPNYPSEIIEIAVAVYQLRDQKIIDSLSIKVQPIINRTLSTYCKKLLGLSQSDINKAEKFDKVSLKIANIIDRYKDFSMFICSWGDDYNRVKLNAHLNNTRDPFNNINRMDLMEESKRIFSLKGKNIFRDDIVHRLRLPHNPLRHNALSDAIELLTILEALENNFA